MMPIPWTILFAAFLLPSAPTPAGLPPACVVDIDGTLTGRGPPGSPAYFLVLEKGREELWRIHRRGVAIFYLSARPVSRMEDTRRRQAEYDYPPGEIIMKGNGEEPIRDYKIRMVKKIQETHRVLFGIGDTDIDMEAYAACGITALHLHPSTDRSWEELAPRIDELIRNGKAPPPTAP